MSLNNQISYFDNNSTTPTDKRVLNSMLPFLTENYANSSSSHHFGITINKAVKKSRYKVVEFIGSDSTKIIFTSSATEAINFALKDVTESYSEKGKHIITVSTEHYAVLDTCKRLETKGYEVTYLPVLKDGLIDLTELKNSIREDTILVCIMHVNKKTGVIQPIKKIASIAQAAGSFFITDATQAIGKKKIDTDDFRIDLMYLSGHKMNASKGIDALYVRQSINKLKLPIFIHRGGHERGVRSGTLNDPGIIALANACEIAQIEVNQDSEIISVLCDELENELVKIEWSFVNGNRENKIFNPTNICFPNVDANILIGRIKIIAVSIGSVCTSAVVEPSHVLTAMGLSEDEAFDSLSFSLGR
jgi:cysteine desulfurase